VGRHHAAARSRIVFRSHRSKQHFVWRQSQDERQSTVSIVGEKPVIAGFERHTCRDEDGFVTGATDLKENFALVLELDFPVVESSRQHHPAIGGE